MKENKGNNANHPNPPHESIGDPDRIIWRSEDSLVTVRQKVRTAKRFPQHDYPIVVLELRPSPNSRIQWLANGTEGVQALLTHNELQQYLYALNRADHKVEYVVQRSVAS